MKRTTILIPDEIEARIEELRRAEGLSRSEVLRRALYRYFEIDRRRPLPFKALGRSGRRDTARRAEEILAAEWGPSTSLGTGPSTSLRAGRARGR